MREPRAFEAESNQLVGNKHVFFAFDLSAGISFIDNNGAKIEFFKSCFVT
jgi:hypothetical protein